MQSNNSQSGHMYNTKHAQKQHTYERSKMKKTTTTTATQNKDKTFMAFIASSAHASNLNENVVQTEHFSFSAEKQKDNIAKGEKETRKSR